MSSSRPMRLGSDFRNQMWATGAASSMWPMRSRRTLDERHFNAALLADDALVLHPLVLAAQALVVLDRPEDAGAEQPVTLRLEGAVVDRLRLLDLAEGPREDLLRGWRSRCGSGRRSAPAVAGLKTFMTSWFIGHFSSGRGQLPQRLRMFGTRTTCRTAGSRRRRPGSGSLLGVLQARR